MAKVHNTHQAGEYADMLDGLWVAYTTADKRADDAGYEDDTLNAAADAAFQRYDKCRNQTYALMEARRAYTDAVEVINLGEVVS